MNRNILDFIRTEAGSGLILAVFAAAAILWANSPWAERYFHFIHYRFALSVPGWRVEESVLEWTKEGLMAIFFFVVGLEIKYEIFRGELSSPRKLALPVIAAIGGMAVPALTYVLVNIAMSAGGADLRGWSVPTATDIAFALAVLALVGKSLPASLRLFLLTLAIVDDLGAVMIIGIFYNAEFHLIYLAAMAVGLAVMAGLGYILRTPAVLYVGYAIAFLFVWAMSLKAGLSPSLAAVAAAFCVMLDQGERRPVLKSIIHALHPLVAYAILPFFAFTAAGFSLAGAGWSTLADPRLLGIAGGLFIGKQIGIFAACWLAVRCKIAVFPAGATPLQLYGVCLLCGIGFTMSLYIGALAFPEGDISAQIAVKSGVILGSLLSACAGAAILACKPAARAT